MATPFRVPLVQVGCTLLAACLCFRLPPARYTPCPLAANPPCRPFRHLGGQIVATPCPPARYCPLRAFNGHHTFRGVQWGFAVRRNPYLYARTTLYIDSTFGCKRKPGRNPTGLRLTYLSQSGSMSVHPLSSSSSFSSSQPSCSSLDSCSLSFWSITSSPFSS